MDVYNMTKATLETTKGIIELELYDDETPNTVKNFVQLIQDGYYDGLSFHRVVPDFVIQGGCPKGDGTGGPGYKIADETSGSKQIHSKGALSMANAGPNTNGSQFFIVLNENNCQHLNGKHTVFGKTTKGLDVVQKIEAGDKIKKATVEDVSQKIQNKELEKM
jgi:peptidyl-prolyl cis-trans isomerase B (cyclophilin B)